MSTTPSTSATWKRCASTGCAPSVASPIRWGEGPVIVNAFCNFYKQLEYPGDVLVKMYVSDPARSTFESWGTMERGRRPGVIYGQRGDDDLGQFSGAEVRAAAGLDARAPGLTPGLPGLARSSLTLRLTTCAPSNPKRADQLAARGHIGHRR